MKALRRRYGRSRVGDAWKRGMRQLRELNRRLFYKSVAVGGVPLAIFKKDTWKDLDK